MNDYTEQDIKFMKRAIELGYCGKGQTSPNPAVGAVIVKNGKIIGEGFHRRAGGPHAEIEAINNSTASPKGAILYVTLEPCSHYGKTPPCADAIIKSGIKEVVAGIKDPFPLVAGKGFEKLRKAGIKVRIGILKEEAIKLIEDFITFHTKKRPFVHIKWAMSLDGKTSTDIGDSKWISNESSREYAHKLRSYCDAILVGGNTLRFDDPELTVRLPDYKGKQPIRVILDETLDIAPRYKIFNTRGGRIIIFTSDRVPRKKIRSFSFPDTEIIPLPTIENGFSLKKVLQHLKNIGVQSVLVEGGRRVAGSFFDAKLIDKLTVFIAPILLAGIENRSPLLTINPSLKISDGVLLKDVQRLCFNDNICVEGYPVFKP